MAVLLPLLRHATRTATAATDAELLAQFSSGRDEDAFAELIRRHGPVVYRICCRLVGPDAADDAFQATFLVLATRLNAASAAGSIGGWLVGVAGRVARQMRRGALRRTRHEVAAAETRPIEWTDEAIDLADQFRVLDEELARLPNHLRDPVVLCLLHGRTQEQAASELGRDARTLRRRLERAKQVLRARLERRGVIPAVAAALVAGAGSVTAAIPHDLGKRTVSTVFNFLTGGTAAASSQPAILAKGIAMTMFTRKLMHGMVAATFGLLGLGVVLAGDGPPAYPPPPVASATTPMPLPAPPIGAPVLPQPPAMPVAAKVKPELSWERNEAAASAILVEARRTIEAGQKIVVVQALCVRVPIGFCERSGLTAEDSLAGVWILTQRERRMLTALFRTEPDKEVVTQPMITLDDGQTGFVQVGEQMPVVTGLEAETKNGKTVYTPKILTLGTGATLRVTPKVGADGHIMLRIETQNTDIVGTPVQVPVTPAGGAAKGAVPEFLKVGQMVTNEQTTQTTVVLPDSGTVVVRCEAPRERGTKPTHEVLWVLTANVVRGDANGKVVAPPAVVPPPPKPAVRP
jgi:RNA polymerase sigma factor (sigma-70 family)